MVTHNICIHTQVLTVDTAASEMVHWLHTLAWHSECWVLLITCRHVGGPVGYKRHRSFRQCTDFRVSVWVTEWQTCGGKWVRDLDRVLHMPFYPSGQVQQPAGCVSTESETKRFAIQSHVLDLKLQALAHGKALCHDL